jgi:hypothetical protein
MFIYIKNQVKKGSDLLIRTFFLFIGFFKPIIAVDHSGDQ